MHADVHLQARRTCVLVTQVTHVSRGPRWCACCQGGTSPNQLSVLACICGALHPSAPTRAAGFAPCSLASDFLTVPQDCSATCGSSGTTLLVCMPAACVVQRAHPISLLESAITMGLGWCLTAWKYASIMARRCAVRGRACFPPASVFFPYVCLCLRVACACSNRVLLAQEA